MNRHTVATQWEPAAFASTRADNATLFNHVFHKTHFKKKEKKTPLNFSTHISSGLWMLWMSASECQRFHASRCCCWISRNLRWREEERLRRPVPEISHEGMFLHVCANDWPWHSRVAVVRRRTATEECCLWLCLFGLERHCRHSIVLVSEDLSCIPERAGGIIFFLPELESNINFSQSFVKLISYAFIKARVRSGLEVLY